MAHKCKLASPMQAPFKDPNVAGDIRDRHDQNPHDGMSPHKHDRSKDTLPLVFFEGEDRGQYMGKVDSIARDILSSPMNGQRRSATGERESVKSVIDS